MLGKDKVVEMINGAIEQAIEYETNGDGLEDYSSCFEHSENKEVLAKCLEYLKRDKSFSDLKYDDYEKDYPADLLQQLSENLDWFCDMAYVAGIFMDSRDKCTIIDSVSIGEIYIQFEKPAGPLFTEYFNRYGDGYISDGGVYATVDGYVCYRVNLEKLSDYLTDNELEY